MTVSNAEIERLTALAETRGVPLSELQQAVYECTDGESHGSDTVRGCIEEILAATDDVWSLETGTLTLGVHRGGRE